MTSTSQPSTADLDCPWTQWFPYETVYEDQVTGIETFLETLAKNGYYQLEGACGTGKTMIGLVGAIHAIRRENSLATYSDPEWKREPFTQAVAVTPVKTQLEQFTAEMRMINAELPSGEPPIDTVVLRGQSDIHPYAQGDTITRAGESQTVDIGALRRRTRALIGFESDVPLRWPSDMDPPAFSAPDYDWNEDPADARQLKERLRYDPYRAEAVRRRVAAMASTRVEGVSDPQLTVDGVPTPYQRAPPVVEEVIDRRRVADDNRDREGTLAHLDGPFDPFYAAAFAEGAGIDRSFRQAEESVFDRKELFECFARDGVCPYEAMLELAGEATVVLGNYNHVFDPETQQLLIQRLDLFGPETALIVDEAHQLESRCRDLFSTDVSLYTLQQARRNLQFALQVMERQYRDADLSRGNGEKLRGALQDARLSARQLRDGLQLVQDLRDALIELSEDVLVDEYGGVAAAADVKQPSDVLHPLVEPEQTGQVDGELIEYLQQQRSYDRPTIQEIGKAIQRLQHPLDDLGGLYDADVNVGAVGRFLTTYAEEDATQYHRELWLEAQPKSKIPEGFPEWVQQWTPRFHLYNCLPRDGIRNTLAEFGGGIVMSATLEPFEVFAEGTGIESVPLRRGQSAKDTEIPSMRPHQTSQFPLRYPEERRLSLAVDAPKYTSTNRGKKTQQWSRMTDTRQQFAAMLQDIAESPGNILIAMPNYGEAHWAAEWLTANTDVPVFVDKSSTSRETEQTLARFFQSENGVICTSCLGTITEGVDYEGDRLHGVAVIGVPLRYLNSRMKAVRAAYDESTSMDGFEAALSVPAVRKVRQAIGRVIRGEDETGVRIFADKRYTPRPWNSVQQFLSDQEQNELQRVSPDRVGRVVNRFWERAPKQPGE